jgi:hypothetical protein
MFTGKSCMGIGTITAKYHPGSLFRAEKCFNFIRVRLTALYQQQRPLSIDIGYLHPSLMIVNLPSRPYGRSSPLQYYVNIYIGR